MTEPLNNPPEEDEGNDQDVKEGHDDVEIVTVVDILNTRELEDDDDFTDEEAEADGDEPDA